MKQLFLILTVIIFFSSCKKDELSNSEIFQNQIWYVDSTVVNGSGSYTGEVLKPMNDSIFDIYRDQIIRFEKFKFKGDSLLIKKHDQWKTYSLKKSNNNNIILIASDTSEKHYLQNLTKLFEGESKRVFNKSTLFNELNNYTWYVTKVDNMINGVVLNEPDPSKYYLNNAFYIPDTINNKPFNAWFEKNYDYRFSDQAFYLYSRDEGKLLSTMYLRKNNTNELILFDSENWNTFTLKKIDYSILE